MLFNSDIFLLGFLPVVFAVYVLFLRSGRPWLVKAWLGAASLFFYAWWNPAYLTLLLVSVAVNFITGSLMLSARKPARRKILLFLGCAFNLLVLGYYKYALFALSNAKLFLPALPVPGEILLPLAISFFTFTQITYLCDAYERRLHSNGLLDYLLFVAFFPHLIAGPIVHHRQMVPQFHRPAFLRLQWKNIAAGVSLFILGLFKKIILADHFKTYAEPFFEAVAKDAMPGCVEAWMGALAFTLQLYLDFSAYSDMALGLALMFNLRFPINFFSPYKASSLIDFWHRWHITLSRFLRDYVYIPLGGSRVGELRRYSNLFLTMLVGGIWHGAGWTFVAWGVFHGLLLALNHAWRALPIWKRINGNTAWSRIAPVLTFVAVMVGWVLFKAHDLPSAGRILGAMTGFQEGSLFLQALSSPDFGRHVVENWPDRLAISFKVIPVLSLLGGLLLVTKAPNAMQIFSRARCCLQDELLRREAGPRLSWRPTMAWSVAMGAALVAALLFIHKPQTFLYFQF